MADTLVDSMVEIQAGCLVEYLAVHLVDEMVATMAEYSVRVRAVWKDSIRVAMMAGTLVGLKGEIQAVSSAESLAVQRVDVMVAMMVEYSAGLRAA